MFEGVLGKI